LGINDLYAGFPKKIREHSGLEKVWAYYKDCAYQLILGLKRAFYFCNNRMEKPIVIGLNFHYSKYFDVP